MNAIVTGGFLIKLIYFSSRFLNEIVVDRKWLYDSAVFACYVTFNIVIQSRELCNAVIFTLFFAF